jgi:hypothetical protein
MALTSNAVKNEGKLLRHFTSYPLAQSDGVNYQYLPKMSPYVFSLFYLLGPVLKYLNPSCTLVYPYLTNFPSWWPTLKPFIFRKKG